MSEEAIPVASAAATGAEGFPSPRPDDTPGLARHAFRVGGLGLLVPRGALCEAVDMPPIARLPNTAPWLLGIANLRGAVVPVFNLAHALGLAPAVPEDARLLVIGEAESAIGVVIDALPTLERFAPNDRVEQLTSLPPVLKACATACFAKDGRQWTEFAPAPLFLALAGQMAAQ